VSSGRLSTFAGSVIVIAGAWHLLQGVAALVNDGRYVGPPNYIYKFELTGWGWIYLVIGVFAVPVGAAVFTGQLWGPGGGDPPGWRERRGQFHVHSLVPAMVGADDRP
jgi:hypothetical protein